MSRPSVQCGATGFVLVDSREEGFAWDDVQVIIAYKRDLLTVDEICLDLGLVGGRNVTLTEELDGWTLFIEQLEKQFPSIPADWWLQVAFPPFATNTTVLFERAGRFAEGSNVVA